jgi:hypothetical protein
MHTYADFLQHKTHINTRDGFEPTFLPDALFDFQKSLVEWSVRQGRSAIFADCGLGKTLMQLVWAENVARHTNKPVLVLTPLAVNPQTIREGELFGIDCKPATPGPTSACIYVTNYERLHHYNAADYAGVVCDESSILKSMTGVRRKEITQFMTKIRFRLLCTATAAPNDYTELGTSSEALGFLAVHDVLQRFFVNMQNTIDSRSKWMGHRATMQRYNPQDAAINGDAFRLWRLKGHAETEFWRWVCSWARAIRRPSDIGFDDARFILPELINHEHIVKAKVLADGSLFDLPAVGLREQRDEANRTITERCEKVAELTYHTDPAIVWCQLNAEGDLLEKLMPDAIQISGRDSDESKEKKFISFLSGESRVLITKPKIGAWGLNFQHCNRMTFFPSHSFEQYYQGVRRCWRFGQKRDVTVDVITTEGGKGVLQNLQNKAIAADKMFERIVSLMDQALNIVKPIEDKFGMEVPAWL